MTEAEELELLRLRKQKAEAIADSVKSATKADGFSSAIEWAGKKALSGINAIGEAVTEYVDKPARRLVGAPETGEEFAKKVGLGKSPLVPPQFAPPKDEAPKSFAGFALKGLSSVPANVLGATGYDMTVSPLALLPMAPAALRLMRSLPGANKAKSAFITYASAKTGLPEKVIETYASRTKDIDKLIKESGGDFTLAEEALQKSIDEGLKARKAKESARLQSAIENAPQDKVFSAEPAVREMQTSIPERIGSRGEIPMGAKLSPENVREIEDLTDHIISQVGPRGKASLEDLHQLKKYLQTIAEGSYKKDGQIFIHAKPTQNAARSAGFEARQSFNEGAKLVGAEDAIDANAVLERLHKLEKRIDKALLTQGKPAGKLIAAGANTNPRIRLMLQRIEELSGVPATREAENLAAAKHFSRPDSLPIDTTGKTLTRLRKTALPLGVAGGVAGGLGGAGLEESGLLPKKIGDFDLPKGWATVGGAALGVATGGVGGLLLAGALSSPAALKRALQLRVISLDTVNKLADVADPKNPATHVTLAKAVERMKTAEGQKILQEALKEAADKEDSSAMKRRRDTK